MALSGIAIYKVLPQTNCKECGFPTCLAFAMKLAARQAELSACPYVSDEAKALIKILCRTLKFGVSLLEKWLKGEKLD